LKHEPTENEIGTDEKGLQRIQRWSIEHPHVVIAFFVGVIALAILAITQIIPRRFAPYLQSPMLGVVTEMSGLSAEQMELYVSKPLEDQLINVQGLKYIRSTSQQGFSIVTLEFPYGTNMEKATVDVQNLLTVAEANLPTTGANKKPSFIIPIDPLNLPVVSLSLTGDLARGWTLPRLRALADNQVIDELRKVPDVYAVVPYGGYHRQLQVVVDQNKLLAYHLSILDVKAAIDANNLSASAGIITHQGNESIVTVNFLAPDAAAVANYPIKDIGNLNNPQIVRISNVAHVTNGIYEKRSGYDYLNHSPGSTGRISPSIEVSVIQNPGASSATVVPAVMSRISQLEVQYPGIHFTTAYSNSHFVNLLFRNAWDELAFAIFLTGIAVLLFLGEWRGALITLVTLPTSLACAILLMVPFGMTFNSGTLIGLLLSIGRLVDDSIIDIHAVERYLRLGKTPKIATILGIAEVRAAVIASTLMIVIALVPLVFSGGLVGQMFVELVWPLIFGLIASMIVSFTLTPVLASKLLRPEKERERDLTIPILGELTKRVLIPIQARLDRFENGYAKIVTWMLHHRLTNFARILATIIIGGCFYFFIGSEVMPLSDTGQASAILEMQPGTSFQGTSDAVKQIERIMLNHPELQKASIELGTESMNESWSPFFTGYEVPGVANASMMLTFSDKDNRKNSIFQVMDSIQGQVMRDVPGVRRFQIKEMGSDIMATADAPIHLNVYGPDLPELHNLANQVLNVAKKSPDIFQPAITSSGKLPGFDIRVDPNRAQAVGLTPDSISKQAYYSMKGGLVDTYMRSPSIRQNSILIRYKASQRDTGSDIGQIYLNSPSGLEIPLSSVATVVPTLSSTAIEHDGLRRVVGITGYYRKGHLPSMDAIMELVNNAYGGNPKLGIKPVDFPPGYGLEARGDMTQMMDSVRRLASSLALSICLMYLVLVAQFRGFLQPLQMIASLPLELAGVFVGLFLAHQAFSTVSILGIIVLTGMDITTAVLLIDLIMRYRDQGIPRDRAVVEACRDRLRPILMTSIITLIVMIPIAVAPKTGLDAYQPLATAVVAGLTIGTILTLFDIPILHTLLDDGIFWLNRIFLNREYHWNGVENSDPPISPHN